LNPAWPPSSEEGVADANVVGSGDLVASVADFTTIAIELKSASAGTEVRSWISYKRRQKWAREIWMVHNIEELSAKLQGRSLSLGSFRETFAPRVPL